MIPQSAKERLITLLGARGVLDRAEDLTLYEYDGGVDKAKPELVVFPRSTAHVTEIVKIAQRMKTEEGIEALVLAGTELPLLLRESPPPGLPAGPARSARTSRARPG